MDLKHSQQRRMMVRNKIVVSIFYFFNCSYQLAYRNSKNKINTLKFSILNKKINYYGILQSRKPFQNGRVFTVLKGSGN